MSSRRATFLPSFLLLHRMNELERGVRDCLYIMWNQQHQQHTGQTEQQWQRGEDNNNALMQCTAHIANNNEQMPILFESRRRRVVRERVHSQRTHSAGISTQCSLSHTHRRQAAETSSSSLGNAPHSCTVLRMRILAGKITQQSGAQLCSPQNATH